MENEGFSVNHYEILNENDININTTRVLSCIHYN